MTTFTITFSFTNAPSWRFQDSPEFGPPERFIMRIECKTLAEALSLFYDKTWQTEEFLLSMPTIHEIETHNKDNS